MKWKHEELALNVGTKPKKKRLKWYPAKQELLTDVESVAGYPLERREVATKLLNNIPMPYENMFGKISIDEFPYYS